MPIRISKQLRAKLPEAVRANAEQLLWAKSGAKCFLCLGPMNEAADAIEADHDIPESHGGTTEISNLNLSHEACNRAKRSEKTVDIRPYLQLVRFTKDNGGRLKYNGYLSHFGIDPKPSALTEGDSTLTLQLPDGSTQEVPVFSEANRAGAFRYVYASVPRSAIFNDDACQPRTIRVDHAWSIYKDLQENVLHEPPSLRVEDPSAPKAARLLMFDGQHKTVAAWMSNRERVVVKIYLNLTPAEAIKLVNSVQSRIKKLPLSPFELAAKMSDELQAKWDEYEALVGTTEASEAGFLQHLGSDKERGKAALQSALIQQVLASPDLRLLAHLKLPGSPTPPVSFTEQTLKGKVLAKLLCLDALNVKGALAQETRDAEVANIVMALNHLNDLAFEPPEGEEELTPTALERARRMTYQSSLEYISALVRQLFNFIFYKPSDKGPMAETLSGDQMMKFREGIQRIVEHPAWTAEFTFSPLMGRLQLALQKNQDVPKTLDELGLALSYLMLGENDTTFKNVWLKPMV